jgi:putative transposase
MTKLRHYDNLGTGRFVTFSCYRRLSSLNNPNAIEILIRHIDLARQKHQFKLFGYVIMPEHVHLVLFPPDEMKLGLVVREIKSRSAKEYFKGMSIGRPDAQRVFWQSRCYDHNCRTFQSVVEKVKYCHQNPVRRGLVDHPGKWRWSSYNWYHGKENVPLRMDMLM